MSAKGSGMAPIPRLSSSTGDCERSVFDGALQ